MYVFLPVQPQPSSTLFPYTTLFRSTRSCTSSSTACRGRRPWPRSSVSCCSCTRSEEHTSELQSRRDIVCRLLLEKKKNIDCIWRVAHVILPLQHFEAAFRAGCSPFHYLNQGRFITHPAR